MLRMLGLAGFNPLDPNDQFEIAANRQFVEGLNPPHFIMMQNNPGIQVYNNSTTSTQPAAQVPTAAPVGPSAPTGSVGPLGPNATQNGTNNGGSGAANNANNFSGTNTGSASSDQTAQRDRGDLQNFNRGQGPFGGGQGFGWWTRLRRRASGRRSGRSRSASRRSGRGSRLPAGHFATGYFRPGCR